MRCLERKARKIELWSLLQSKSGLNGFWNQLRMLAHLGVTESALDDYFEAWKVSVRQKYDETTSEKFEAFCTYFMRTFGSKPQEWSSVFIPESEADLNILFTKTTNGSEANNRTLNRFLKSYTQGSLLTISRYIRDLFEYHLIEMNKYESGQKKTQLSSHYKTLCKLTLRVKAQKTFGVIETGADVAACCLKLLAAEAEAEKQSETIGKFRLWCQSIILEDPRLNIFFKDIAVIPNFKKSSAQSNAINRAIQQNNQNPDANVNQYFNLINQSSDESYLESESTNTHSTLTEFSIEQNPVNELNFISPSEIIINDEQVI